MVTEARLERVASGLAPVTPGWFVVNTADAAWTNNECVWRRLHLRVRPLRAAGPARSDRVRQAERRVHDPRRAAGTTNDSLPRRVGPGGLPRPDGRVHAHHRRPGTAPAGLGLRALPADDRAYVRRDGEGPCVILATGNRRDDLERVSRRSEAALRYDAGPDVDTTEPERRGRWEVRRPKHWDELPWAERT